MRTLLAAAVLILPVLKGGVITFDESPATNDGLAYGATILGATFSPTNAGIWGGLGEGDPGEWNLEGTNGSQFLGFNLSSPLSETVTFSLPVDGFSADFSPSLGSEGVTITLTAFNGATTIDSTVVVLGAINTWSTLSLPDSGITSVTWTGSAADFGVDNVVFGDAPVPEPGSLLLIGAGFLVLGVAGRRANALLQR